MQVDRANEAYEFYGTINVEGLSTTQRVVLYLLVKASIETRLVERKAFYDSHTTHSMKYEELMDCLNTLQHREFVGRVIIDDTVYYEVMSYAVKTPCK